jgi:hypothetical protein
MSRTQDIGSTIYESQDGQVLVTADRLVLGSEQWRMDNLASVTLVRNKHEQQAWWLQLSSNPGTRIGIIIVFALAGALFYWAEDSPQLKFNLVVAGVVLVLLLPVIILVIRRQTNLPDTYKLQLALREPPSPQTPKEYTAAYTWNDQLQARGVEQAILQALARGEKQHNQ